MPLRELLNRKARSSQQDQVVILASDWSDFTTKANADAYDANIRWMASRPWIQIVTPQQIAAGLVDGAASGAGTTWGAVNRGTNAGLATVAKDYVDHATEENYDNWFNGAAGLEEGLAPKVFNKRPSSPLPSAFGRVGVSGIADSAWTQLSNVSVNFPGLQTLARGGFHGSMYLTAFHNQANGDLSKFSTGAYIYPDISYQTMARFSRSAQAQVRWAAVYARVSQWAASANAGAYNSTAVAEAADVDLDGENEYLIYNARIFAVFEAIGGRLTAAWVRDISTGKVFQTVGNPLSYSGFDDETEGAANVVAGAVGSYRTSGFKDWFAAGPNSIGYNNDLYSVTAAPTGTGWRFTSSDGKIVKTITLAPVGNALAANYALSGGVTTLYVRHGMSPHLLDLLKRGQAGLGDVSSIGGFVNSQNIGSDGTVRNYLRIGSGGFGGATFNATAVDSDAPQGVTFDTVKMRNQAQTQQIELAVTNGATFSLGFETGPTLSLSTAGDGLPDSWIAANNATGGAAADNDGDGLTNLQEFIFGKNPRVADGFQPQVTRNGAGYDVSFGTIQDRFYRVFYSDDLQTWNPLGADILGDGASKTRTDDGTASSPAPGSVLRRFYRVEVRVTNP